MIDWDMWEEEEFNNSSGRDHDFYFVNHAEKIIVAFTASSLKRELSRYDLLEALFNRHPIEDVPKPPNHEFFGSYDAIAYTDDDWEIELGYEPGGIDEYGYQWYHIYHSFPYVRKGFKQDLAMNRSNWKGV